MFKTDYGGGSGPGVKNWAKTDYVICERSLTQIFTDIVTKIW